MATDKNDETHVVVDLSEGEDAPQPSDARGSSTTNTTTNTSSDASSAANAGNGFNLDVNAVTAAVGSQVLKSGSESASKFVSTYGRIDVLRPYFDIDTADLRQRLIASMWPKFSRQPQVIATDLYGPTMLALTLSAVLLLSMKHVGVILKREGTLIGTSFAVSFGYWLTLSGVLYAFGFIFNTNVTALELVSVTGYSLFSYCLVLLSSYATGTHLGFYGAWIVFGVLGSLRLGLVLRSRTPDTKQGFIVFAAAAGVHLLYLMYLQYAYATIYLTVSGV